MSPLLRPAICTEPDAEKGIAVLMQGPAPKPASVSNSDVTLEAFLVADATRVIRHTTKYTEFIGAQLIDQLALTRAGP